MVASELTRERALTAGIEVVELDGSFELDLALDGADEVDGSLGLIKGGGGALLREKIVISAARRFVVVAEAVKKVDRLGEGFRLPVEVVRFGWRDTRRRLAGLAAGRRTAEHRGRVRAVRHGRGPLHPGRPDPARHRAGARSRTPSTACPASWSTVSSSTWQTSPCWVTRTARSSA